MTDGPVILLGFDAMDADRVARLQAAGLLPNLRAHGDGGVCGSLEPRPALLPAMVCPAFQTGQPPHEQAHPAGRAWQPERMRLERGPANARLDPFWEHLPPGTRVLALDVPFSGPASARFAGRF